MNMPRHIKPKPIHVLVAVRTNSVRIIVMAFPTAWQAPARLLVEERREELASRDVQSFGRPSRPVRGKRQPGSPDDGPNQAGRADRGPQHQVASSATPRQAGDDARKPDGAGRELPRRCKIGVGRTTAPNVPDRQRGGCKSDGEAVAGEGRDMGESVADAIDSGSSLFAWDNSPSEIAALPPRRVRHRARESTGRFVIPETHFLRDCALGAETCVNSWLARRVRRSTLREVDDRCVLNRFT